MFEESLFATVYSILIRSFCLTGAVFVSSVLCYILWKSTRTQQLIDKIPGFKDWPLVGDVLHISSNPPECRQQILELTEKARPERIFKLKLLETPWIFLFTAKEVEQLLSSNTHLSKSDEYQALHRWLGYGLLTSTGSKWKSRRHLLTPSFHFSILKDYLVLINKHAVALRDKLQLQACDSGEVYDILDDVTLSSLDIICDTAMGVEVEALFGGDSDYVKAVYLIKEGIAVRTKTPLQRPDIFFNNSATGKRINKAIDFTHQFTLRIIKERREAKLSGEDLTAEKGHKPFLDILLDCRDEKGDRLTDNDVREEVDTFMFEGHDTTSSAIMFTIHLLGANPECQTRCQEEVDEIIAANRDITQADLSKLTYLEWCIKESMRIFPPVPIISRTLAEEINIAGYVVPKGISIAINISSLHRDPEVFPNPETFDPTRFSPENCTRRHPYAYVPFSAGPRNCIGQRFAMMEIKVVMGTLLKHFNFESMQTAEELSVRNALVLQPDNGIKLKMTSRH